MNKFWLVILAVLLIGVLILGGCSSATTTMTTTATTTATSTTAITTTATSTTAITTTATQTTTTTKTTTPATQIKTGGTLRMGTFFAPVGNIGWTPDPMFQQSGWGSCFCIEALILLDLQGNMMPQLATNWKIADDMKSITLNLRQGVKFHDGSDFNAEVAKWNIDLLIDAHAAFLEAYKSVAIIDNYTIRINLNAYNNAVPHALCQTFMISKAAFDKKGKDWMMVNPVGTGPFKFVSYTPNVVEKFVKNPDYWQKGKPYLDAIEISFIGDAMTRASAFEAGEVDLITQNPSSVEYDLKQKGYPVSTSPSSGFLLIPDSKNVDSPLSKLQVRQAVDYAINRDAIVKNLGFGWWHTTYQYTSPQNPAYIKNLIARTYDRDKAKKLLAEAGYANGFSISLSAPASMTDMNAVTAIQGYLNDVGIKADINALDGGGFGSLVMGGWKNGFLTTGTSFFPNLNIGINFILTQNNPYFVSLDKTNELQQLWEASAATKDYNVELVQKMLQYIHDDAYVLPLYTMDVSAIMKPYVKDTGFFSQQWIFYWDAANAWMDK
jgi:peptide/nickel transport system substrate-binding protein